MTRQIIISDEEMKLSMISRKLGVHGVMTEDVPLPEIVERSWKIMAPIRIHDYLDSLCLTERIGFIVEKSELLIQSIFLAVMLPYLRNDWENFGEKLKAAIDEVSEIHKERKRLYHSSILGTLSIAHLYHSLKVSALVAAYQADENAVLTALLHDVPMIRDDASRRHGEAVADILDELFKADVLKTRSGSRAATSARLIRLCDIAANSHDIHHLPASRRQAWIERRRTEMERAEEDAFNGSAFRMALNCLSDLQ